LLTSYDAEEDTEFEVLPLLATLLEITHDFRNFGFGEDITPLCAD
jgi:hypothetical protein